MAGCEDPKVAVLSQQSCEWGCVCSTVSPAQGDKTGTGGRRLAPCCRFPPNLRELIWDPFLNDKEPDAVFFFKPIFRNPFPQRGMCFTVLCRQCVQVNTWFGASAQFCGQVEGMRELTRPHCHVCQLAQQLCPQAKILEDSSFELHDTLASVA